MSPAARTRTASARVALPSSFYDEESLRAAAAAVGAELRLTRGAGELRATLTPKRPGASLETLAGEFLNEALSHEYRAEVIRFHRGLTAPVLARAYEDGFLCVPWDPLEEMDAQLAGSRADETERLLEAARPPREKKTSRARAVATASGAAPAESGAPPRAAEPSRLGSVDGLPALDEDRVGPHRYRRLGGDVLVTGEGGRFAYLSPEDYRAFADGAREDHPRWNELAGLGVLRHCVDFDALAADAGESELALWPGPKRHVVRLDGMEPATARGVADFAFTVPGAVVELEAVAEDPAACAGTLAFLCAYAARRSEWNGRLCRVWARLPAGKLPKTLDAGLRADFTGMAKPPRAFRPPQGGPAPRALLRAGAGTKAPREWIAFWRKSGFQSVRLMPDAASLATGDVGPFLRFYTAALDAMLEDGAPLREEWAAAALRRIPADGPEPREEPAAFPPGFDVLAELAYDAGGGLFTSEAALALPSARRAPFQIGAVPRVAYEEFPLHEPVRLALAAQENDHQPLCHQCAYKPYCGVPAAENARASGTPWGQTPSSPDCAWRMGVLDALFERMKQPELRSRLMEWADRWSYL